MDFEARLQRAVDDGAVPGAVVFAGDMKGNTLMKKALGRRSLRAGDENPMQLDTVFSTASMTKLLTTICVLQLHERGLVQLDEDISSHVPVLAGQQILTGFSADARPIFEDRKNPITLQQLLTHSSGCGYSFIDSKLIRWRDVFSPDISKHDTINERFNTPLVYQPGEGWCYGSGVSWAGRVVESLTGMNLEAYMRENLFKSLHIEGITFYPDQHPDIMKRQAGMTIRDPDTNILAHSDEAQPSSVFPARFKDCFGGEGAYADLSDYFKIVHSLLLDDERFLKKETAALMFKPHLPSSASKKQLEQAFAGPPWVVGDFSGVKELDWGYGGLLVDGDGHEWRKRGCLIWCGAANLYWFIDRAAGVCGVFGTQVFPGADVLVAPVIAGFETEVYRLGRETMGGGTRNGL